MKHEFHPVEYYTTIGPHAPVLRVKPGDAIVTTTVDAAGHNEHGDQIAPRGNPMTGPFFVEGAEPGDTLAVTFDSIRPNRRNGFTAPRIAPGVLEPWHSVDIQMAEEHCTWEIDVDSWSARLVSPRTALAHVDLPLSPMLGCFGVAPARRQAISTATSGPHGGNMDYRGFCAGTTVFLPVEEPGALFFLGDGHAIQGDGEIVGTGVEVSMEVEFRIDVQHARRIGWPRAENETHIMTVGNARPLDQCVQHATSEMVRWLTGEYGLPPIVAHSLLGQIVEYEIANVFDPAYTVVCKARKDLITALASSK